jgi:hypothetical protein
MDAYEREHMGGKGAILHRQKVQAPRWALAVAAWLPAGLLGALGLVAAASGAPWQAVLAPVAGGLAYGVGMTGLMLALAGGRIAVSEGELHVQIGPFGPRIPIDQIERCEVGASGLRSWGLGAQKLLDGTTVYKMLGDNATSARITTRDGRKLVIVCPDAHVLVAAVRDAVQRQAVPRTRVESERDGEGDGEREGENDGEREKRRA